MKYKKINYIIVLVLMFTVGMTNIYANTNYYYMSSDQKQLINDRTQFYEQEEENIRLISGENYGNALKRDVSGNTTNVDCETIFGNKNDPNSLRYLIDEILMYPKILIPIVLILLGVLDFGKAVIAPKEDEMKKAQATFVKRVIAAVAIFFVPVLIDLIMELADIVWAGTGYSSCGL